jgi:beta-galactosidase/beta-glucuronidase
VEGEYIKKKSRGRIGVYGIAHAVVFVPVTGGLFAEGTGRSELTDIVCPMYTSVPLLQELHDRKDEDRPIILCEYSHSMNNSNGNIQLYWEKFWDPTFPRLQGGYIWDFKDQGLRKKTKDGREFFAYGGDFGDTINDQQFCINGLFSPDLDPHPSVEEIKYLQQPVKIETEHSKTSLQLKVLDNNKIILSNGEGTSTSLRLMNRYTFRDLSHLTWKWELHCSISQFPIGTGFAGDDHGRLSIGWTESSACHLREVESKHGGVRYFLNIMGVLRENSSWADAGHVIVREQYRVNSVTIEGVNALTNMIPIQMDTHASMITVRETQDTIAVASPEKDRATPFVTFSKVNGSILSLCWDGQIDILGRNGLTTNYTRAATDNDRGGLELVLQHMMLDWARPVFFRFWGYKHFSHLLHWREHGLTQDQPPRVVCHDMTYKQQDHVVVISADCSVKNKLGRILFQQICTYTVCAHSRQIQVRNCPSTLCAKDTIVASHRLNVGSPSLLVSCLVFWSWSK